MACLPTLTQLKTKHVDVSSLCPLCHSADETIVHCLITCQIVQLVWNRVGIGTSCSTGTSFLNWCMDCFKVSDIEQKCLLVTLCWAIRGARNDLVWNGKSFSADNIVVYVKGYLDQWRNAQNSRLESSGSGSQTCHGTECWTVPPINRIKVNVDASIFEGSRNFGIGFVARDDKGLFMEGGSLLKQGFIQPVVAEALGVKEVLSWIKEKGWTGVHVETDCLNVTQALRSAINMRSLFGNIIKDYKALLSDLSNVSVYFVKRSANRVAHSFARVANLYPGRRFSLESVPTDLLPLLR
ncbi:hypothetical protein CsatA_006563 [Cannabis sativa]